MARYGTDIETLARYLSERKQAMADPSVDALLHLALAFAAVKKLEELRADLTLQGRPLVSPGIERAYREMLHVRSQLPVQMLDVSLISRFGRLLDEGTLQNLPD